jgi:hypothetical protein
MSRAALFGTFVFVVAGLSGCASPAQIISKDNNSVVVAIPDNTDSWPYHYQSEAKRIAVEALQDTDLTMNVKRVKVGEILTNTQDIRQTGGVDKKPDEVTSTTVTSTSDRYEYHLIFQKRIANQVPNFSRAVTPPTPGGPTDPLAKPAGYSAPPLPPPPATDVQMPPWNPPTSGATTIPPTHLPGPGMGR